MLIMRGKHMHHDSGSAAASRPAAAGAFAAVFERMEGRLLLDVAPVFATPPPDAFVINPGGRGLTIGIDGYDEDGDALSLEVASSSSDLTVSRPYDDAIPRKFARLHFVQSDGVTSIGDIVVQLLQGHNGESLAAVERFVTLSTNHVNSDGTLDPGGVPFYSDVNVHRIIDDFMIQSGDPVNGDGTGGSPLGSFPDTFDPVLSFIGRGVLAMANSGVNTNDSQFFITEVPTTWLDQYHMIFGQVVSGWDVLETLSQTPTDAQSRPIDMVLLDHVTIFEGNQDDTITLTANASFTGDAEVTLTLRDAQDNVATQVIKITPQAELGSRPVTTLSESQPIVFPGQSAVVATVTDDHGADMEVWLEASDPSLVGTVVTVDPVTHEVTADIPAGFRTSSFAVRVLAKEAGYDNVMPSEREFYVWVAGNQPTILAPNHHAVEPGGAFSFTPQVTDDGPTDLHVAVEASRTDAQVTIDPVTYEVHVVAPDDLTGVFYVNISAVETGFDDREAAVRTVYVFSQHAYDPTGISQLATSPDGQPIGTFRVGDLLYVANGEAGLEIWDLSDLDDPGLLGVYPTANETWAVQVDPDARIAGQQATVAYIADAYGGVVVLDVSDPADIEMIDTLIKLDENSQYVPSVNLHMDGDYLYVADGTAGMRIWNITNADDVRYVTTVSQVTADYRVHWAVSCTVHDGYAYVVDYPGYFFVFDVANPAAPHFVAYFWTGGRAWDVKIADDRAYVVDQYTGLIVADVHDPAHPTLLGYEPLSVSAWAKVAVGGNMAAVTTENGYVFLDVSDPAAITQTYTFTGLGWGGEAAILGDQIALPIGSMGVSILDADVLMSAMYIDGTRTFPFAGGRSVTFKISGPGLGRIRLADGDPEIIAHFDLFQPTDRTSVAITTRNGDARIVDIDVYGSLKSLLGKTTDLLGNLFVEGLLGSLQLDDVAANHLIEINADALQVGVRDKVKMIFGRVVDTSIHTHGLPIDSLTVTDWRDTDAEADVITAPWIGKLTAKGSRGNARLGIDPVAGDFAAALSLDGAGVAAGKYALGSASIAGEIAAGLWQIAGAVGTIKAAGTAPAWGFDAEGPVKTVDARNGLAGSLAAAYFDKISTKGDLTAAIHAEDVDARKLTSIGTLAAGSVRDVSLDVPGGINTITVTEWLDTDGSPDTIRAGWLARLTTKGQRANPGKGLPALAGDFQADLLLTAQHLPPRKPVFGGATIAGGVADATWAAHGQAGAVTIRGDVNGWAAELDGLKSLTAGNIAAADLKVADAIGSVKAYRWAAGSLHADSLKSLNITGYRGNVRLGIAPVPGNLGADVTLEGLNVPAKKTALGSAKIAGDLVDCAWDVRHNMGKLTVVGTVRDCTIRSDGTMLGLTLGAAEGSDFLAGVADNGKRHAETWDDFADPDATIKSIQIRGWRLGKNEPIPRFLTDSNFSAAGIGTVSLLNPGTNEADPFGLYVQSVGGSENIASIRCKDTLTNQSWSWRRGQPLLNVGSLTFTAIQP